MMLNNYNSKMIVQTNKMKWYLIELKEEAHELLLSIE
jgi:hypothetical protein